MSLLRRLNQDTAAEQQVRQKPSILEHVKQNQEFVDLEVKLHQYLIEELKSHPNIKEEELRSLIHKMAEPFIEEEGSRLTFETKRNLLNSAMYELTGFGPITPLLADPQITEIMVNGPNQVYIEKGGQIEHTPITFHDDEHVSKVIQRIVTPLGRRIDESTPMVDARLPGGSRVNAIIPPLALHGPTLTIRKFSQKPFEISDLIQFGTLNEQMAKFIDICVKSKLNVFISGGTGSGKTSTLNVLSSFIPDNERIITIEDAAELKLSQEHVLSLETRPPNIEGKGEISIRDLVRNSLRMRPDRIVVGEVRSAEALDMLQAMNTGHEGSLATGHANTPRDILSRLETMVLMAGMDLPLRAIREQISSALDIIIHQSRMKDGSRKITHITEVLGMEGETIVLQDIFLFVQIGVDMHGKVAGYFTPTGIRPFCTERLEQHGFKLPAEWFNQLW